MQLRNPKETQAISEAFITCFIFYLKLHVVMKFGSNTVGIHCIVIKYLVTQMAIYLNNVLRFSNSLVTMYCNITNWICALMGSSDGDVMNPSSYFLCRIYSHARNMFMNSRTWGDVVKASMYFLFLIPLETCWSMDLLNLLVSSAVHGYRLVNR